MTIKATYTDLGNDRYDVNITCEVSGLPLDQVDPMYGMHCSDPSCKCLAESKSLSADIAGKCGMATDEFMKELMNIMPPNIGDGK